MGVYPIIAAGPTPWLNSRELALQVTVAGHNILAIPSQDAVTGDVHFGEGVGFEAKAPYILCRLQDVDTFGDLHGVPVVIGDKEYVVRNVRPKENQDYVRLVLDRRK